MKFDQVIVTLITNFFDRLRLAKESSNNVKSMQQSYETMINGLNQELLSLKANYDQLNADRQALIDHRDENREIIAQTSGECDRVSYHHRSSDSF